MKRYPLLTFIRIGLALSVALRHYFNWMPPIQPVPAFLGISGLVIPASFERSGTYGRFLWKRALRLVPVLLVVAAGLQAIDSSGAQFLGAWLTADRWVKHWNTPVWSLGWEEIAYAWLALMMGLGVYRHRWAVWLMLGVSYVAMLRIFGTHQGEYMTMVAPLGCAFFVGNLAYLYREDMPHLPLWLALAALANQYGGSGQASILNPITSTGAIVWVGMNWRPKLPAWAAEWPDWSYSSYLTHMVFGRLCGQIWGLPVTILWATFSWYAIEKPCLKLKDFRWKASRPDSLGTPEPSPLSAGS